MRRGDKQIAAAMQCAEEAETILGVSTYDAAVALECAVIDGDEWRIRQQLGTVIRKAMSAAGVRRAGLAQRLAQDAATRNAHKGDWHQYPLRNLIDKLYEEIEELYKGLQSKDRDNIRMELGDVIWTATMVADHILKLGYTTVTTEAS